jgi:hypothetical protein
VTALCGGGNSAPKPVTDPVIGLGGAAVAAFVKRLTGKDIDAIAGLIAAGLTLVSAVYCGTDPPADPGLTPQDALNALNYGDPAVQNAAINKFSQWFLSQYWYTICECTSGSTPAPPVPSDPGPVGNNTGLPGGSGSTCFSTEGRPTLHTTGATQTVDLTSLILPITGPTVSMPAQGFDLNAHIQATPIPTGVASFNFDAWYLPSVASSGNPLGMRIVHGHADGTVITDSNLADANSLVHGIGHSLPFLGGETHWGIYMGEGGSRAAGQSYPFGLDFSFNCTGGNFQSPCCPPDPILESVLYKLSARVDEIWALVSAGQGHGAYTDGPRHAGLSGEGTITIEPSSAAIRIEIKSDLTGWPANPQVPTYYYSLGFVTPFALGTPLRGQRIIYHNQTFTWPSYTDTIGYTLAPGLTIDLVELNR